MQEENADLPQDVVEALEVAGRLIDAGIPVFAAAPCPGRECHQDGSEYHIPARWQLTVPSRVWLQRWQPGWALAAVGGHLGDFLDVDPRHDGDSSEAELMTAGHWPRTYGVAATPSGGRHYLIAPLHEGRAAGVLPGLDYQGGRPDGTGRAFVWIAPTVRRSKAPQDNGARRAYRWVQEPDLEWLAEGGDESGEMVLARIQAARAREGAATAAGDTRPVSRERTFTLEQAKQFVESGTLDRLRKAQIGGIEDAANAAAVQLSHFVPDFLTEDQAFTLLMTALSETAYDPTHPASGWHGDKFRDIVAGRNGRAPDDWRAQRVYSDTAEMAAQGAQPAADDVDALLAEMLSPAQVAGMPPPRELVKGLLTFDSESWMIGAPGSRKSFVALDLAGHVALGIPWQGLKVVRSRVVMIVAEGAGGTGLRVRAFEKTHRAMGDQVFILPRPVQSRDVAAWAVLVEACRRLEPGLVVLDTQARVTVGLEENSATDMGVYVEAVSAVRTATGACVLTVHHTGRRGGDARGSSAIDGAQSTEIKIESTGPLAGRLVVEKQKDLPERAPMPLKFVSVTVGQDADGENLTSLALLADPYAVAAGEDGVATAGLPHELAEPHAYWYGVTTERAHHQRHILQALWELAPDHGLTETDIRKLIEERWGKLTGQTWKDAWAGTLARPVPGQGAGEVERIVVSTGGQRWGIHETVRRVLVDQDQQI